MGKQNKIEKPSNLFHEDGSLLQKGWATNPILTYNKEDIGKSWLRIKEWDHYSVLNKEFGFQLTIGDIGYLTQMAFTWLDFKEETYEGNDEFKFFTKSKILPLNSLEDSFIEFPSKKFKASIEKKDNNRILKIDDTTFNDGEGIKGEINLYDNPEWDNTVVVTGYEDDPEKFYYNHKINQMPARGVIRIGKKEYEFKPESSFGLMDWGRGIWPYKTHWLWGSAAGIVNGAHVSFNIGYGFGDLSTHTENIVFYNGKAHKLDEITFHHDDRDPEKPWTFTSNNDRFKMTLEPIIPRKEKINFGLIYLDSSLIHGTYSGYVILDDGQKIEINDMIGHAEDIFWRW